MPSDAGDVSSASASDEEREEDMDVEKSNGNNSKNPNNVRKPASNAKDPSRPRRKKARRACVACQRAHLTCGDERPCLRCVKRGLADSCQDGYRKKAKYLHDAPAEALMPGFVGDYSQNNDSKAVNDAVPVEMSEANSAFQSSAFLPQAQPSNYQSYGRHPSQMQISTPAIQDPSMIYGNQQSPIGPQRPALMQSLSSVISPLSTPNQIFPGSVFDVPDQNLFDMDISSMNFGNHYGALEFGMLNHISSGADKLNPSGRTQSQSTIYEASPGASGYSESGTDPNALVFSPSDANPIDWTAGQNVNSKTFPNYGNVKRTRGDMGPFAYSIEAGPYHHNSPNSMGPDILGSYENSGPDALLYNQTQQPQYNGSQFGTQKPTQETDRAQSSNAGPIASISNRLGKEGMLQYKKRRRDPSSIYESVRQPYPYTEGFHTFVAFIRRRFSSQNRLRIAQALSRVRPSFIACTRGLEAIDLLMMEKVFQRSRLQLEEHIASVGIPTIICRRTGEVACVGKEFTLLTGWRRDVLLGREPNLNTNIGSGGGASGTQTGNSTRGWNTPRLAADASQDPAKSTVPVDPLRPQPVFLAELLDDDSVIQFYEEFANVAFADSRESVKQRCMVLKYKTASDAGFGGGDSKSSSSPELARGEPGSGAAATASASPATAAQMAKARKRNYSGLLLNQHYKGEPIIRAEAGMQKLGDKEGKVDCMCTWTVKRDMFDMPMMIVLNFLPVLETRE